MGKLNWIQSHFICQGFLFWNKDLQIVYKMELRVEEWDFDFMLILYTL